MNQTVKSLLKRFKAAVILSAMLAGYSALILVLAWPAWHVAKLLIKLLY